MGIIGGLESATNSFLSLATGYTSDRIRRRIPFLGVGYALSALAKTSIAFTFVWGQVLFLRILDRAGKAIRTPARDALIASSAKAENRGFAFGFHRSMDTVGAILGALIAVVAVAIFGLGDFTVILVIGGLIGFASLIPMLGLKEEKLPERPPAEKFSFKKALRELPKPFLTSIVGLALFAAGNLSYLFFLARVNASYTDELALGMPLLMYLIFHISYAIFSTPLGSLSDQWGRRPVLMMGFALYGLVGLGFVLSQSTVLFVILFILYGVAVASLDGNQRAWVADLTSTEQRGMALGVFSFAVGITTLIGNVFAGWLWQAVSAEWAFAWSAAMSLLGAVVLFMQRSPRKK